MTGNEQMSVVESAVDGSFQCWVYSPPASYTACFRKERSARTTSQPAPQSPEQLQA